MKGIRRLACISAGFAAGVFCAHYIIDDGEVPNAAVICLAAVALSLPLPGRTGKRLLLLILSASFGIGFYTLTARLRLEPTEALSGKTLTVLAEVSDYPQYTDNSTILHLTLRQDGLPESAAFVAAYDRKVPKLEPGDVVEARLTFKSACIKYGEYYDYNLSKGLTASAVLSGDIRIVGRSGFEVEYFPKKVSLELRKTLLGIFPQDSAPFMLSMIAGDKTELYDDVELNTAMSASGIAHIVAVSGMHVAFLVGFLQLIFGKRRALSLACVVIVWLYVLVVGAPPSAVRAGIMQTLLLCAPIFGRESDAVTSLCFALTVILLINPFACGSVGLQLSFGAMTGIVLFSEPLYNKLKNRLDGIPGRAGSYIAASISSSLAVSVFTVPLIAVHFGYISLYSVLTNVLCLWMVSAVFTSGIVLCLVALISVPVASFAAGIVSYGVRYITAVAKLVMRLPYAALYVENTAVLVWLCLIYAALAVCLMLGRFPKLRLALPVCLATLLLVIAGTAYVGSRDEGTLAALDVGNGQCLVFTRGGSAVAVDCGSSGTLTNAGEELAKYLSANGRTHIDCLVLTHLDSDHANGLQKLLCLVDVDMLIMPSASKFGDSAEAHQSLRALARRYGVEIHYSDRAESLPCGEIELRFYSPYRGTSSNDRGLMLTVSVNGFDTLITGDAGRSAEKKLVSENDLSGTDILIVGHHGSDSACTEELVSEARPASAVISTGYNTYGHPSYRVLTLLEIRGIELHRTDTEGRVVIGLA